MKEFGLVLIEFSFVGNLVFLHWRACINLNHVVFCGYLHVFVLQTSRNNLQQFFLGVESPIAVTRTNSCLKRASEVTKSCLSFEKEIAHPGI
jgi:hypothetical protein